MAWGKNLRERREELGYTLEFAEEETKIRKYYLEALENDHFSLLPPKIYASGFVKQYARLLGFDEKQLVDEFKRLAYGDEEEEHIIPEKPADMGEKRRFRVQNLAAAVAFLVLAIWLGNYLVDYIVQQGIKNPGPDITQQEKQPGFSGNSQIDDETPPDIKLARVEIEAQQKCWIWVKVDNETAYTGTLEAGEHKKFEGKQSVYIKAGNAGGIEITYNDHKEGIMGMPGEVKEVEFSVSGS